MYFCSTSGRRYLPTASPREATADAKRLAMRVEQRHDRKRGLRLGPPLRRPDVCMISDGGVCLIVTTPERAVDFPHRPVEILSAAQQTGLRYLANEASCVLLDPVCAVPAVVDRGVLARDVALLVGLDASGWDKAHITPRR